MKKNPYQKALNKAVRIDNGVKDDSQEFSATAVVGSMLVALAFLIWYLFSH
jgi:hypothetical protein